MNLYKNIALDLFDKYLRKNMTVGLGSGNTLSSIIRYMGDLSYLDTLKFVATSLQIKLIAESFGLKIFDENIILELDIVLDGADQVDSNYYMIKGGGGALFKEKILISASKKTIILAQSHKFVRFFHIPIPIEVHPFARKFVINELIKIGGTSQIRMLEKGYPFITENGNIIYDTSFKKIDDPINLEMQLKKIPGIIEVGVFTICADAYYKIGKEDFTILFP